MMSGSLQARHTLARGAATVRTISRSSFGSIIPGVLHPCIEAIETRLPNRALRREPFVGRGERASLDGACAHTASLARPDPAAAFEQADVLHERRQRHSEGPCELRDARRAPAQPRQHGAPGRIGQSLKDAVEPLRTLSHEAKYHGAIVSSSAK